MFKYASASKGYHFLSSKARNSLFCVEMWFTLKIIYITLAIEFLVSLLKYQLFRPLLLYVSMLGFLALLLYLHLSNTFMDQKVHALQCLILLSKEVLQQGSALHWLLRFTNILSSHGEAIMTQLIVDCIFYFKILLFFYVFWRIADYLSTST
ncbi:hypothetical protein Scep_024195 [Stephania cephalantha]|uniref:Uncharacterized protein n=1 Tax=Stephania cephalantha TaxID=152367 RepID=A0AAP0EW38_9MAGN